MTSSGFFAQVSPLDLLDEVLAVEQVLFRAANPLLQNRGVLGDVVADRGSHHHGGPQGGEVEARTHSIGAPELDVVSVVMGFLQPALAAGIPLVNAVVEAGFDLRPEAAQPVGVAADPPVAMDFEDAAELAVGSGVEVVGNRADRQCAAELLVSAIVLRRTKLRLAERPLQRGEEVRDRLGVIPNVRAGARAAALAVSAPFPRPEAAVGLCNTVGDFRMVRFAATASMTSGGKVVS